MSSVAPIAPARDQPAQRGAHSATSEGDVPEHVLLARRCAALPRPSRRRAIDEGIKRVLDIALALCGIVLLSPLLLAAALCVRFTSPGPVVYRGLRTGRYGRPFHVWKFRTMVADAEKTGGTTTGRDDPRVTRVGRFLRERKLDELPQLVNVLRGEMSIVGPRPEVYEYTSRFTDEELRILSVRPGITDFSSIRFADLQTWVGSDDPDRVFRERILPRKNELRLKYVDERSLWCDLGIIVRTSLLLVRRFFARFR